MEVTLTHRRKPLCAANIYFLQQTSKVTVPTNRLTTASSTNKAHIFCLLARLWSLLTAPTCCPPNSITCLKLTASHAQRVVYLLCARRKSVSFSYVHVPRTETCQSCEIKTISLQNTIVYWWQCLPQLLGVWIFFSIPYVFLLCLQWQCRQIWLSSLSILAAVLGKKKKTPIHKCWCLGLYDRMGIFISFSM